MWTRRNTWPDNSNHVTFRDLLLCIKIEFSLDLMVPANNFKPTISQILLVIKRVHKIWQDLMEWKKKKIEFWESNLNLTCADAVNLIFMQAISWSHIISVGNVYWLTLALDSFNADGEGFRWCNVLWALQVGINDWEKHKLMIDSVVMLKRDRERVCMCFAQIPI